MSQKTILVAEDNLHVQRLIKIKLEWAGYRVETTEDGQQAWERLQEGGIDLLITNLILPVMDGFELIALVHARESELATLPILFMSIRPNPSEWQMPPPPQEQDWTSYWLAKPFNPLEVISILNRRLRPLEGGSSDTVQ